MGLVEKYVSKPCSTKYKAAHNSGYRKPSEIRYVVIHSTEGDTAEGAASWFANPQSSGSANLVIDDSECFRTVDDLLIPWAAPPLNSKGFHIELAGYAKWSKAQWLMHQRMLHRSAFKAAQRCRQYKIPPVWVGLDGLQSGKVGLTSHKLISLAFKKSTHVDPGPNFPYWYWVSLVKMYYNLLGV